jgi:uncharacterized protein
VDLTALDGRAFERFLAAGTYFLKKYRGALNDLNVFPVPDGDTGSNMYLTARAALGEVVRKRAAGLGPVAAAAATGSLLGARGNSGVILSQMLRGFARWIGDRPAIGSEDVAAALQEAVRTARAALQRPVEGTMITVGTAAAEAATAAAPADRDLVKLLGTVVDAAAYALARTPEQLPILREAGVVDSGGAGLLYFLEGILRFRPGIATHETAYPQNATRDRLFTASYAVSENKYCTEFVLENARVDEVALRELLAPLGESLIVAGAAPTLKVHIHTADADVVRERVAPLGEVTRLKVDDMSRQHDLLLVDAPTKPFSVFAVVPGDGFAQIARELGADQTLVAPANPSVGELVVGANSCLTPRVYLLPNEGDVILAANQAAALSTREVVVVPTRDVPAGLSVLLALSTVEGEPPTADALMQVARSTKSAALFFAGKDSTLGGVTVTQGEATAAIDGRLVTGATLSDVALTAAHELGAAEGGALALYFGGRQTAADAASLAAALSAAYPAAQVECYYGGQPAKEYVMSIDQ